jgi:alpha-aminoadipate/glutamate carrier protein LysW
MATCPECDNDIDVDEFDVDKGDPITCPECGSSLEVTSVSPVELDVAAEEDEDELDEDETDEDDEDDKEENWDE